MKIEPIEFEVDGLKLRGRLYQPAAPKSTAVLFLHGWTGLPNDTAARFLAEHGYRSMTISLSGHGESEGGIEDQTRAKSLKEVLAAYDLFKSKFGNSETIVAAGNSYGGYMAALLSVERPLSALQLRVPANYLDEGFDDIQLNQGHENQSVTRWREQKLPNRATRALRALHSFAGPVQILEAENDELIPHQCVQNYIDAVADKSKLDYHLMKSWPHSLGLDPDRNRQYQELLLNWLDQKV